MNKIESIFGVTIPFLGIIIKPLSTDDVSTKLWASMFEFVTLIAGLQLIPEFFCLLLLLIIDLTVHSSRDTTHVLIYSVGKVNYRKSP